MITVQKDVHVHRDHAVNWWHHSYIIVASSAVVVQPSQTLRVKNKRRKWKRKKQPKRMKKIKGFNQTIPSTADELRGPQKGMMGNGSRGVGARRLDRFCKSYKDARIKEPRNNWQQEQEHTSCWTTAASSGQLVSLRSILNSKATQ